MAESVKPSLEDLVLAERVRMLYRTAPLAFVTVLINSAILAYVLWDVVERAWIVGWLAAIYLSSLARAKLTRIYQRRGAGVAEARRWGRRFALGAAVGGVIWGAAGILFFADALAYQVLLAFVLGGMSAGAASAYAAYYPAFLAFVVPALAPLVIQLFARGDKLHLALGVMLALFGSAVALIARWGGRTLSESAHLRFQNTSLERDLAHAQKMEALGRMAGGIAHDFNNLLMGIRGCCDQAARELPPGSAALPLISQMRSATEQRMRLARQLLDFSRKREFRPRPIELNRVIRATETLLRQLLGAHINLNLVLEPEPLPVRADPVHIEQILMNLAANARDAMPKGGTLRIETRATQAPPQQVGQTEALGECALLQLQDTGCGIDPEVLRHIFEPFYTTKPRGMGTGLGLPAVYGIVAQLGGVIEVESEVDVGTTFTMTFPRLAAPCELEDAVSGELVLGAGSASAEDRADPSAEAPAAGETVLVVDDERLVRISVSFYLRQRGYHVLEAGTGEEALALLRDDGVSLDALLTDIVLPDLPGIELARELEQRQPRVRVVFMSAHPSTLLVEQGQLEAGRACLQKPFSEHALIEALRGV